MTVSLTCFPRFEVLYCHRVGSVERPHRHHPVPSFAVYHLECNLMHVHWMGVAGGVVEFPDFRIAHCRVFGDRIHPLPFRPDTRRGCRIDAIGATVPRSASTGPSMNSPGFSGSGVVDVPACSMSASGRVTVAGGSGGTAGKTRFSGGVDGSGPTAGTTLNCIIWPVVSGSAAANSPSWGSSGGYITGTPPPKGSSGPTLPRT